MKRYATTLLLMTAVALTGCCKRKSSDTPERAATSTAPAMTAPPTPNWKERELSFKELPARATFMVKDLSYSLSFSQFPAGTHIIINGKDETVSDSGALRSLVDISDKVAAMAPKDATDYRYKLDPAIKVSFRFPGDIVLDVDAPALAVWFDLKQVLEKVNDHPVLFGKESEAAPAQHTMLYLGVTTELFGPGATMGEVDWVAVREKLPLRSGKMCHGYKDAGSKGSGKERSLQMQMQDEDVAIYARRTGKLVDKKKFTASSTCPLFASGGSPTSYPSSTEVKAWLRGKTK